MKSTIIAFIIAILALTFNSCKKEDTNTSYEIKEVSHAFVFARKGLTSAPVTITVIETKKDGIGNVVSSQELQASPDEITSLHPEVVRVSGKTLQSINPGFANVKVTYKGVSVEGWVLVQFQIADCWGLNDGSNFQMSNPNPDAIYYHKKNQYTYNSTPLGGAYHFPCDGINPPYEFTGFYGTSDYNFNPEYPMAQRNTIPTFWDASTGRFTPGFYLGDIGLNSCLFNEPTEIRIAGDEQITIITKSENASINLNRGEGSCGSNNTGDIIHDFQTTTSFDMPGSWYAGGDCQVTIEYKNLTVSANYVNNSVPRLNIYGDYWRTYASNIGILCESGPSNPTTFGSELVLGQTNGFWSASSVVLGAEGWSFSNGVIDANQTQLTGTITFTPSNGSAPLSKQITLNVY